MFLGEVCGQTGDIKVITGRPSPVFQGCPAAIRIGDGRTAKNWVLCPTADKNVPVMLDVFKNLDVLGILRLGLAGLCFLLSLLAFFLIYREQGREGRPREGITRAIYTFMAVNLVTAIIVGTVGLVTTHEAKKASDVLTEVPIKGQLEEPEAKQYSVIFKGMIGMAHITDDGFFEQKCPNNVNVVILEFGRAGAVPEQFPLYLDQLSDKPLIFKLAHSAAAGNQRVSKPTIDSTQIAPTTEQLPPLQLK